jgi:hypothetical protein
LLQTTKAIVSTLFVALGLLFLVNSATEIAFSDKEKYRFSEEHLAKSIDESTEKLKKNMDERMAGEDKSIRDMFEMQLSMNKVRQLSEISSGVESGKK